MLFDELDLPAPVLEALKEMGYEETTPIQEKTLPHILSGKDVLGLLKRDRVKRVPVRFLWYQKSTRRIALFKCSYSFPRVKQPCSMCKK